MKRNSTQKYIDRILSGIDLMPGGFMIYRGIDDGEILYVNAAIISMYDCEDMSEFMELTGGTYLGMVYDEDRDMLRENIRKQFESDDNRYIRLNFRIITRAGNIKYVEDYGRYRMDTEDGPICYAFISDLLEIADPLTGLPNRKDFLNRAAQFVKYCFLNDKEPVMLSFNLSGMKGFNARNGIEEGDRFLCIFVSIIKKYFGEENCSRFGEDKFFAFGYKDGLEEKLDELIQDLYRTNNGNTLPVKIGICHVKEEMSVHLACDYARIACEAQKTQYGSRYGSFDEKMAERYVKAEYILNHFEQALDEGWIHIYLQPVVRTLTERVCGYEALARWIDPVYGFISPGVFVPILEENGLSYRLDTFIVRRVAEIQSRNVMDGNPIVPISVNISRSDFDSCSPADVIIDALDEYGLRRNCICVEITETALINNEAVIKEQILRFNEAGIEVWMDDFGSGFSSLNLLKDYQFDEIKIDMLFLKDFSEKSRIIMTMAVRMAKELGIHTLAEGVENREQIEFLKSIGCEKIQGYYYSKPLPVNEIHKYLSSQGLLYETREDRSVYEKTGLIDVVTQQPVALVFYDGEKFSLMFSNDKCMRMASIMNGGKEADIETIINKKGSFTHEKLIDLAKRARKSHQNENMTFVANGRYFYIDFLDIADSRQGCMILAYIDGKMYEEQELQEKYDYIVRNVVSVYSCIYVLDYNADTRTVVFSNLPYEKVADVVKGIRSFNEEFAAKVIHPEDVGRWNDFTMEETFGKKFTEQDETGFFDIFRLKQLDGSYKWIEFHKVPVSGAENRKVIVCVKPFEIDRVVRIFKDKVRRAKPGEDNYNINDDLMNAIKHFSGIRFFWKDRNRRFLGVTDAFLDFYGFKSPDVVLGKTDEDVGWHIDDGPFKSDEERVLQEGEIIHKNVGQNVVDGVTHYIAATKFPVYNNGEIVGLMGYMIDIEHDIESENTLVNERLKDPVTGFMNAYGQILTLTQLDDNMRINGEEFAYIVLDVPEFEEIRVDYGRTIAEKLVKAVAERLVECFGHVASIFRLYGCRFGISKRNITSEEIIDSSRMWRDSLKYIREVEGRQVTIHGEYAFAQGSERNTVQEIVELANRRLNQKMNGGNDNSDNEKSLMIEYFNRMPLPYVVVKLIMSQDGKTAADMEILYANKRYGEMVGKNSSELTGRRYIEFVNCKSDKKWLDIGYRAAFGEYIYARTFSYSMKRWVNFIAAPAASVGTFSIVFIKMYEKGNYSEGIMQENLVDEFLDKDNRILSDIEPGGSLESIMSSLIQKIDADRIFIMERNGENISNTFEWCREGVESVMEKWQNLDFETYVQKKMDFLPGTSVAVKDIDNCRYINPDRASIMGVQGIRNLIEIPFYISGKLWGFIGVDNYNLEDEDNIRQLLEHTSYFLEFNEELRKIGFLKIE